MGHPIWKWWFKKDPHDYTYYELTGFAGYGDEQEACAVLKDEGEMLHIYPINDVIFEKKFHKAPDPSIAQRPDSGDEHFIDPGYITTSEREAAARK